MAENIQPRYYYWYAEIDLDDGMCIGVRTQDYESNAKYLVPIEGNNEAYLFKYYTPRPYPNGGWYTDAAGTIPWSPTGA